MGHLRSHGLKKVKNNFPSRRISLERMHRILQRIQKGDFPNRRDLAEEIEVNEKTVQRDISFMKDFWQMPIEYDPYQYGYYLSKPVSSFPLVQLSQQELVAVFIAEKAIAQYAATPFEQPLRTAFKKLTTGLDGQMAFAWSELENSMAFKNIEATSANLAIFQKLSAAIQERKEVSFDYKKLNVARFETRHVRPLQLGCVNHQWYLFSFCIKRQAIRTFALTRMKALSVHSIVFTEPKHFSATKHLQNSFGVFAGKEILEVTIKFDRFAAQLVRERTWHPTQKLKDLTGGQIEVSFTLSGPEEIESWILSWGSHAKVIAPKTLAARVKRTLKESLDQY